MDLNSNKRYCRYKREPGRKKKLFHGVDVDEEAQFKLQRFIEDVNKFSERFKAKKEDSIDKKIGKTKEIKKRSTTKPSNKILLQKGLFENAVMGKVTYPNVKEILGDQYEARKKGDLASLAKRQTKVVSASAGGTNHISHEAGSANVGVSQAIKPKIGEENNYDTALIDEIDNENELRIDGNQIIDETQDGGLTKQQEWNQESCREQIIEERRELFGIEPPGPELCADPSLNRVKRPESCHLSPGLRHMSPEQFRPSPEPDGISRLSPAFFRNKPLQPLPNTDPSRMSPHLRTMCPDLSRMRMGLSQLSPEPSPVSPVIPQTRMTQFDISPELSRKSFDLPQIREDHSQKSPQPSRISPELSQMRMYHSQMSPISPQMRMYRSRMSPDLPQLSPDFPRGGLNLPRMRPNCFQISPDHCRISLNQPGVSPAVPLGKLGKSQNSPDLFQMISPDLPQMKPDSSRMSCDLPQINSLSQMHSDTFQWSPDLHQMGAGLSQIRTGNFCNSPILPQTRRRDSSFLTSLSPDLFLRRSSPLLPSSHTKKSDPGYYPTQSVMLEQRFLPQSPLFQRPTAVYPNLTAPRQDRPFGSATSKTRNFFKDWGQGKKLKACFWRTVDQGRIHGRGPRKDWQAMGWRHPEPPSPPSPPLFLPGTSTRMHKPTCPNFKPSMVKRNSTLRDWMSQQIPSPPNAFRRHEVRFSPQKF